MLLNLDHLPKNRGKNHHLDVHGSVYLVSKLGYNLRKGLITYLYKVEITQLLSTMDIPVYL